MLHAHSYQPCSYHRRDNVWGRCCSNTNVLGSNPTVGIGGCVVFLFVLSCGKHRPFDGPSSPPNIQRLEKTVGPVMGRFGRYSHTRKGSESTRRRRGTTSNRRRRIRNYFLRANIVLSNVCLTLSDERSSF
jgi:hypothetical protein